MGKAPLKQVVAILDLPNSLSMEQEDRGSWGKLRQQQQERVCGGMAPAVAGLGFSFSLRAPGYWVPSA